jgi:hypothetical protein
VEYTEVVIKRNKRADITSITNIVVIRELAKNIMESQKTRLILVIAESKESLEEK